MLHAERPHHDHITRRKPFITTRGKAGVVPQQKLDNTFAAVKAGRVQGGLALGIPRSGPLRLQAVALVVRSVLPLSRL